MNPLIRFMRHSLTNILTATDDADQVDIEKIDETLTPNMRALRLVMNMSDHLLSMGTPANSVVHMALGVTDTYCKRKVHIDVSFNQITGRHCQHGDVAIRFQHNGKVAHVG